jgi:predicted CXXCH cytochrome family protein
MIVFISCAPKWHQEPGKTASSGLPRPGDNVSDSASPVVPSAEAEADKSTGCLVCHEYRENHHPTDFVPSDASDFPFPLYDGRVRCLTCHVEDHTETQKMLRGGPYADRREICFNCHYEEEYRQIYPHIMMDGDGRIMESNGKPVCLVCHTRTPNPKVDRTKDVVFRADVAFLCWRCHSLMSRAILNEHILLKPSLEMVKYLEQNEQKLNVTIPLVPRDRITCSTCHNPHQKGVITHEPSAKGADAPDRLRIENPALCVVCHIM